MLYRWRREFRANQEKSFPDFGKRNGKYAEIQKLKIELERTKG